LWRELKYITKFTTATIEVTPSALSEILLKY
jgi:hypothetical protein